MQKNKSFLPVLILISFVAFAGFPFFFGLGDRFFKNSLGPPLPQPKVPVEELLHPDVLEDKIGVPGAYQFSAEGLHSIIKQLSQRSDPLAKFMLAEVLFRNTPHKTEALKYYEDAVISAPADPLFLSTLVRRGLDLMMPDRVIYYARQIDESDKSLLAECYAQMNQYGDVKKVAKSMLKRNPYDLEAMLWLSWAYEQQGKVELAQEIDRNIKTLQDDILKPWEHVTLSFSPLEPIYHSRTKMSFGKAPLYGYSEFSIGLKNRSGRTVQIQSVNAYSRGSGKIMDLGDIKSSWPFAQGVSQLKPGETKFFKRTWGFREKPEHQRLSYVFDVCWVGAGEKVTQCHTQRLDLLSDQNALQKYMPVVR